MTTSIPSTLLSDVPAGPAGATPASLAQLLASCLGAGGLVAPPSTAAGAAPSFSSLLGNDSPANATTAGNPPGPGSPGGVPALGAANTGTTPEALLVTMASAGGSGSTLPDNSTRGISIRGLRIALLAANAGLPENSAGETPVVPGEPVSPPAANSGGSFPIAPPGLRLTLRSNAGVIQAGDAASPAPAGEGSDSVALGAVQTGATPVAAPVLKTKGKDTPAPATVPTQGQLEAAASTLLASLLSLLPTAAPTLSAGAPAETPSDFALSLQLDGGQSQVITLPTGGPANPPTPAASGLSGSTVAPASTGPLPDSFSAPLGKALKQILDAATISAAPETAGALPLSPRVTGGAVASAFTPRADAPAVAVNAIPASDSMTLIRTEDAAVPESAPVQPAQPAQAAVRLQGEIVLPNGSTLTMSLQPPAAMPPVAPFGGDNFLAPVNSAGSPAGAASSRKPATPGNEKQILSLEAKEVGGSQAKAGIAVAQGGASMAAPNHNRNNVADFPAAPLLAGRGASLDMFSAPLSANLTPSPSLPEAAGATPALAHRAVETVLGLVDGQLRQAEQPGTVSVNFKFGQEDLAVRVQLRGGEVHTQFRTDSPELRSALAVQWRAVNPSATAGPLRLAEPEFAPASGGASSGFQASTQGQSSSQQQAQHQPPQQQSARPGVPFELGGSRRFSVEPAVAMEPRLAPINPTSLHLAALA